MDPNRTLADILSWAHVTIGAAEASGRADDQQLASVAEQLLSLDRWLRSGGFLPARWQPSTVQLAEQLLTALRNQKAR